MRIKKQSKTVALEEYFALRMLFILQKGTSIHFPNVIQLIWRNKVGLFISEYLFSWIDSICVLKPVFLEEIKLQIEHIYDFLFSWTDPVCTLKLPFWEQLKSQIEHFCYIYLLWTDSVCVFKSHFWEQK